MLEAVGILTASLSRGGGGLGQVSTKPPLRALCPADLGAIDAADGAPVPAIVATGQIDVP